MDPDRPTLLPRLAEIMVPLVLLATLVSVATPQLPGGASTAPADTTALDTAVYASAAVRNAVARAAAINRQVPPSLQSYHAQVESEIALIVRQPGGYEQTGQLEQVASDVRWRRTGAMEQRIVGYRMQAASANISALSYMNQAWTVPVLYGNRLTLFFGNDTARAGTARDTAKAHRRALSAVHPLADDRERVYRYSGGDTVITLHLDGRDIPIVRVEVAPRRVPDRRTLLFRGEMDLDAVRHQLVRIRGEFLVEGGKPSLLQRAERAALVGGYYMELVNREVEGAWWLPAYQRIEAQASWLLGGDTRAIFRVVTRFRQLVPNDTTATLAWADSLVIGATDSAAAADTLRTLPHRLTMAPGDSVRRYDAWGARLGEATAATTSEDFADFAPDVWRPRGRPRLDVRPERFSDVVRFNRVEGLYLGVPLRYRLRDAFPGLTLYAQGGRALSEETWRGTASASLERGGWRAAIRGGRTLRSTNDFLAPWDEGLRIDPLLEGRDEADYLDRRFASVVVAHEIARGAAVLRLESGPASDRAVFRTVKKAGLFEAQDSSFRNVRFVQEGRYTHSAAMLEVHPEVTDGFVRPGVGLRLTYDRGDGGLRYQRAEARLTARRLAGPFTLSGRLNAGVVQLTDTVSQQLYELGDREGLPGYTSKEFGGDQAVLGRTSVLYTTPWLTAPIPLKLWRWRLFLPGAAPGLAVSLQGGWSDVSDGVARAALGRLGMVNDPVTGAPIPDPEGRLRAPVPTDGIRSTAEVSVRFFGGAVALGMARPIDHAAGWKFVFRIGEEM